MVLARVRFLTQLKIGRRVVALRKSNVAIGLSQQQQQNVRRSIVLVLHKTIPAMFTRNVQAPLDLKLCAQYRERLLAYLHRVFGSSQSATDASR
jgi:hypothetical protein